MIKDLKKVKLTGLVFCQQCERSFYEQTTWYFLYIFPKIEDIQFFKKCPLIILFLHEIFSYEKIWKMNDEVKCKLSQICMRQP